MNNFLGAMLAKAKNTFMQSAETAQIQQEATVSVIELAEFIEKHVDANMVSQFLLGDFYYFYELQAEGINYYLEKKHDYILQLDASKEDQILVSYRSYRDKEHIQELFSFPSAQKQ
ncbi:hypothetical protein ABER75_25250 [Niallia taxi]|uniref:hypothetical protein n=1 Tax=Niallia taxi TaxID=2499688 RepID=UPI0015F3F375|nr:hypothetical protein [Niallia taxi]MED4052715.1 hypothetical protein [Niallia taxi]MED4120070.1 hypothetical protein [Niallia taxi]